MRSADRKCDSLLQLRHPFAPPRHASNDQKLTKHWPFSNISPVAWQHIHFHGHYTFCGSRHPIDLDAMVANLTLQEGEQGLPAIVHPIGSRPEMSPEIA